MRRAPRVLTALALPFALAACSPASSPAAPSGTTVASATPTVSYPFTPAATPTIMPSGYNAKPSKGGPTLAPTAGGPLIGKVIVVDPGHSGAYNPAIYNASVKSPWDHNFRCMSTGSETPKGSVPSVTEHALNWDVAQKVSDKLRAAGATVVLTRPDDNSVGPCNYDRALIANNAHADFLISIHADGQLPSNFQKDPYGFHVQTEKYMAGGAAVYQTSLAAAENLVREIATVGQQPITNYVPRKPVAVWQREKDLTVLGGLKLPGVLVEMGNILSAKDLARVINPDNQNLLADGIVAGIEDTLLKPEFMTPSPEPTASPSGASASAATPSATASGAASTPAAPTASTTP